MDPMTTGALITGGASLIGASMQPSQKMPWSQREQIIAQRHQQRQFAKRGIRWKVRDAKKAGIHPLVAMGANTMSYTPQHIDGGGPDPKRMAMANAVTNMGQDIGRAVMQQKSPEERSIERMQMQNMKLQNDILTAEVASKVARIGQQTYGAGVQSMDLQRTKSPSSDLSKTVGDIPSTTLATVGRNKYQPVPSKEFAESTEDAIMPKLMWNINNYLKPIFSGASSEGLNKIGDKKAPKGYKFYYSPMDGSYHLKKQKPAFDENWKKMKKKVKGWFK
jgi:hypothetical protein